MLVDRPGDHTLGITASHGEWSAASLVVEGTTGVPQAIQPLNDQLGTHSEDGEQPAHEVTLRAGEHCRCVEPSPDQCASGGIPGLGLLIERIEGAAGGGYLGRAWHHQRRRRGPPWSRLLALTGGRGWCCLYRIQHGATPATTLWVARCRVASPRRSSAAGFRAAAGQSGVSARRIQLETAAQVRAYRPGRQRRSGWSQVWFEARNCWSRNRASPR